MDGITTLAGHTEGNADGTGAQAGLRRPSALCVDPAGYCLVSDTGNSIVRRISAAGEVDTLRPMLGPGEDADGSGTVFRQPRGLAADALHLYVADSKLHRILRVALGGDFCGVAPGRVLAGHGCRGFKDGTEALFNGPRGLALAIDGRLFIADSGNYRIRCLHFDGSNVLVESVAGDGARRSRDGELLHASFAFPYGLCWEGLSAAGSGSNVLCVSEWEGHRVSRVDFKAGLVTAMAGCGLPGFRDGPALEAMFNEPCMLASDKEGRIFVADSKNNAIRVIVSVTTGLEAQGAARETRVLTLISPAPANSDDPVPIVECPLWRPWGVCIAADGSLLVSDGKSHRVRRLATPDRYLSLPIAPPRSHAASHPQLSPTLAAAHPADVAQQPRLAERPAADRPISPSAELLGRRHEAITRMGHAADTTPPSSGALCVSGDDGARGSLTQSAVARLDGTASGVPRAAGSPTASGMSTATGSSHTSVLDESGVDSGSSSSVSSTPRSNCWTGVGGSGDAQRSLLDNMRAHADLGMLPGTDQNGNANMDGVEMAGRDLGPRQLPGPQEGEDLSHDQSDKLRQFLQLGVEELARRLVSLEGAYEKQSSYTRAVQGLSQAQAQQVEALSAKADRLSQQLRDEKRKNRERDKERDKKKVPILSEVFALEQQLHAEKATVADLEARQREFDARERHLLERLAAAEAAAAAAASNEAGRVGASAGEGGRGEAAGVQPRRKMIGVNLAGGGAG